MKEVIISSEDYHADVMYLSSSDLKLILQDSYQIYLKKFHGVKAEFGNKLALDLGSYIHSLVLEPEKTHEEFIVFEGRRAGKKFSEFKAENPGKIIINDVSDHLAQEIKTEIFKDEIATSLLSKGRPEISIFGDLEGVAVKARADYLVGDKIVDLKTSSAPVDLSNFVQTIAKYKYELSAAFYKDIFDKMYGKSHDFYFVSVCKNPVSIQCYKVSDETLERGRILYKKALQIWKKCVESGIWKHSLIPEV